MKRLPSPSKEQECVIRAFCEMLSVVVVASPGSGKSTVSMMALAEMLRHFPDKMYLMLTFSKDLKNDLKRKASLEEYGATNVDVHSYHSFCVKHVDKSCATDEGLMRIVRGDMPNLKTGYSYDGVIIDEAQDMSELYYKIVRILVKSNDPAKARRFHYLIVGDPRQSIFEFKGSDARFITQAKRLFGGTNKKWAELKLTETRRFGPLGCAFLNNVFYGGEEVVRPASNMDHSHERKPRYVACDAKSDRPFEIVVEMLNRRGYDKVYILSGTLRDNDTMQQLANRVMREYRVAVTSDDDVEDSAKCQQGKVVFSTVHKTKGGERIGVIVFEDPSDSKSWRTPNTTFVGYSRQILELVIIHHEQDPLPNYVDLDALKKHADIEGLSKLKGKRVDDASSSAARPVGVGGGDDAAKVSKLIKSKAVTNLIRFVPTDVYIDVLETVGLVRRNKCEEGGKKIHFESAQRITTSKDGKKETFYEPVSDINGVAIPAMLEAKNTGRCKILDEVIALYEMKMRFDEKYVKHDDSDSDSNSNSKNSKRKRSKILEQLDKIMTGIERGDPVVVDDVDNFLFVANHYLAKQSGYFHRPRQIRWERHNWIPKRTMATVTERLKAFGLNVAGSEYEVPLNSKVETPQGRQWDIKGRIDAITPDGDLVEIKCCSDFQEEHLMQLVSYAWLASKERTSVKRCKLVYVVTGDEYELKHLDRVDEAFMKIVAAKDSNDESNHWCKRFTSDEEFVAVCTRAARDLPKLNQPVTDDEDDDEMC